MIIKIVHPDGRQEIHDHVTTIHVSPTHYDYHKIHAESPDAVPPQYISSESIEKSKATGEAIPCLRVDFVTYYNGASFDMDSSFGIFLMNDDGKTIDRW